MVFPPICGPIWLSSNNLRKVISIRRMLAYKRMKTGKSSLARAQGGGGGAPGVQTRDPAMA